MIWPPAAREVVSAAVARDAGQALWLSERTIYALVRRRRQSGVLTPSDIAALAGRLRQGPAAEATRDKCLAKQKKRAEAVVPAVRDHCRLAGTKPPAANTLRPWVRRVRADLAARSREGAGRAAARRVTPTAVETPLAGRPMAVL